MDFNPNLVSHHPYSAVIIIIIMWRRIVSSHLKTLAASDLPAVSPSSSFSSSSPSPTPRDFLGHFSSESARWSSFCSQLTSQFRFFVCFPSQFRPRIRDPCKEDCGGCYACPNRK